MILYSRQNPIDLCAKTWSFSADNDKFYHWLNQPISEGGKLPPYPVVLQMYCEDASGGETMTITPLIYDSNTGDVITGVMYYNLVPTDLPGNLYDITIDLSLLEPFRPFYLDVEAYDAAADITHYLRSSCFIVVSDEEKFLIKIEYSNTVTNRIINGILFTNGVTYKTYLYAKKWDTKIEIVKDETQSDYKGNSIVVEKAHAETDIFQIIDRPKKMFMQLIAISENDVVYVNGRRAVIHFEQVTESRVGMDEIPFINAFMRVTYADDNGLLTLQDSVEESYLLIKSDAYLLTKANQKLKIR